MFSIWKVMKILKISKFWNCSSIRYSAPFTILPIFILPFDINFIFYCNDSRKFGPSTFALSLIFKFEISAILKFYSSKFWPSPKIFISINSLTSVNVNAHWSRTTVFISSTSFPIARLLWCCDLNRIPECVGIITRQRTLL